MVKKSLALIMCVALAVSATACGSSTSTKETPASSKSAAESAAVSTAAPTETGTGTEASAADSSASGINYITKATDTTAKSADNDLVIAIEGSVSSMDPDNIPDTNAIAATRGVYEMLVAFDQNQKLVPQLAESYDVSDDALTYTFHLRKGIKFQDGTDFNAAAVKANYDRVLDPKNKLSSRRRFIKTASDGTETPRVASVETPDDSTVVFTLTEAWAPFINRMTQFCIISPAAIEKYGNDIMNHPCGTGPFTCKEWVEGDHTTLVRNDSYWGTKASVDSVTIKEVPEAGTRTAMLQTGEADFVYPLASDQINALKGNADVNVLSSDSNIMRYVTLNSNVKELSNVKVRQAMNYAIDKDAYIKLMYAGYGKAASSIVPSIIQGYVEQTAYKCDLNKAKELMKEAGYEKGFNLTLWGDNTSTEEKGMTFVAQQLSQIGINVSVEPMESATLSDKIYVDKDKADINMWYVNWSASDFTFDGSVRALLHSSMCPPASANTAYYNNPKFDGDLDKALVSADTAEQAKYYADAQKLAWDDCPWLFLGNDQIIYSTKSYLSGVYVAPDGAFSYNNAVLAH